MYFDVVLNGVSDAYMPLITASISAPAAIKDCPFSGVMPPMATTGSLNLFLAISIMSGVA